MKRYFCCILFIFIAVHIFGETVNDRLRERIYVQTDKHLYLAGEPVLLKFLTTDPKHVPIVFSKVAYAELIDEYVARIQIKVELSNGTGTGIMQLPTDIPTGYYRLIAYTKFMRNEGTDIFFEKNIAVLNTFQSGYYPSETDTVNNFSTAFVEEEVDRDISLQPNKTTYTTRERGELILTGLPENIHTLSISISGKEIIQVAESNFSLFHNNVNKKSTEFTGNFLPEYEGHIITGKIIDNQTGRPESTDVLLSPALSFPGEGIRFFAGKKNETGDVRFFTSGITGTKEVATVAYFSNEKYRMDIQPPFVLNHAPKQIPVLHVDTEHYNQLLERSIALQLFHYFADDDSDNQDVQESYFKLKPSWTYPLDDYTRFTTMREVFIEFIVGARFRRNEGKQELSVLVKRGDFFNYGTMPLVMLDGVPVSNHDAIYNYDPLSVERINIYYGPCIMGGYVFDGIIELTTYRRLHQNLNLNRATQVLSYEGPQSPFRFHTPDYSNEQSRKNRMPDSRHTLLWNPDVKTDGKNSVNLHFNTSDLTGEFQARVEGITKDGKFIFATASFNIER